MKLYEHIPSELKALNNWVCWKAVPDESRGKIKKIPINPHTGGQAMSNNRDTWGSFDVALRASEGFSGLGFMFGECPYFGVDIDNIGEAIEAFRRGEGGIVSEFVNALKSYTELSQSGNGIHIICKGSLPPQGRRRGCVEMYESGRFFVMTGNAIGGFRSISDCTRTIKPLHRKYIAGSGEKDIIQLASSAKNGAAFSALYSGDTSGYTSASEADLALCSMLAFWCRCDAQLMDTLFRQSGLMREKWDRKQSGTTYGAITIGKAISGCSNVYEPKGTHPVNASEKRRRYSFDDMGSAQRFTDMFGKDFRYNYADRRWMYWDGKRWQSDNDGAAERAADKAVEAMKAEAELYEGDLSTAFAKHLKNSRSNRAKTAMLKEAQHRSPILPQQLDCHRMLFNTPSGVLSLKTGRLSEHDPELFITKLSGTEYGDNARCPLWLSFLDDIFNGDRELIRYVQKAVGYSLSGETEEQCVFFLFGTGRNGKSTFLDIIREIMGDYAANIQPETIMLRTSQNGGASGDIARLKGARLVTTVEPNEGVRINEGLLKQLTGDDLITARKLYGEEFEYKPEFKIWMAANHKPVIRGTDTGIWRRIHMIPFTVQIPESKVDKQLRVKLRAESAAILRWAVEGCLLRQREGLGMPFAVRDTVSEYRREMDIVSAFIGDRCIEGGSGITKGSVLYSAYAAWCDENNEYKMSNTKFGIEIGKRYEKERRKDGVYYVGVALGQRLRANT